MSDYCRQKVLRYPVDISPWDIEEANPDLFSCAKTPNFQVAPTEKSFIDYVLEDEYGACAGEYGKVRELSEKEKEKYKPVFEQLFSDIDMNKVHLVEYCWYNCSEAPDYYEINNATTDPFYEEV